MLVVVANLPFIPFIHEPQDIIFLFYIFGRITGLFLVSPLFANRNVSMVVRVMLTVFITALVGMAMYPDYRGEDARFFLPELGLDAPFSWLQITLTFLKELGVGYLIGYAFAIVFEGVLIAGQVFGVLIGFSIVEIIDPLSGTTRPLMSEFFVVFVSLLMLTMDMHLAILEQLIGSFSVLPIGNYQLPRELIDHITHGTGRMFVWSIQYIAIPYAVLFIVTICLGFMAKVMPEMNIFMIGFPLKIFIGYYSIILAVGYFPQVLQRSFVECENLANIFVHLLVPT